MRPLRFRAAFFGIPRALSVRPAAILSGRGRRSRPAAARTARAAALYTNQARRILSRRRVYRHIRRHVRRHIHHQIRRRVRRQDL